MIKSWVKEHLGIGYPTHPLTVHLQGKDVASVKALLAFGADINCLNSSGQTPLDIALQDDNVEIVEYLASFGTFTGEYMLQLQQVWALEDLHLGGIRMWVWLTLPCP